MIKRRICIVGPSCAGKSTFSEKLGNKMKYPVLHLDQIAHIPGTNWIKRPRAETQKVHDTFIEGQEWIIDGQYKYMMPKRLECADTLVLIKANRFVCLWRYFKRCLIKSSRIGQLENASNEFNFNMIPWILYHQPRYCKEQMQIIAEYPHLKIVVLRSFKDMDNFLENIS